MTTFLHGNSNPSILLERGISPSNSSILGSSASPFLQPRARKLRGFVRGSVASQRFSKKDLLSFPEKGFVREKARKVILTVARDGTSSRSSGSEDESDQTKTPFGYTRKDVLLIGLGVTLLGIGLESGLEFAGVDPLQAGNVVQLVLVLGLTIGWISTYIFRVSNKEMTYAQQLRDYENKVMEKRLEGLTEAELVALLEQVEEEKRQTPS